MLQAEEVNVLTIRLVWKEQDELIAYFKKESEPVISMEMYETGAWNLETASGSESLFHVSTYHRAASGQGGERR